MSDVVDCRGKAVSVPTSYLRLRTFKRLSIICMCGSKYASAEELKPTQMICLAVGSVTTHRTFNDRNKESSDNGKRDLAAAVAISLLASRHVSVGRERRVGEGRGNWKDTSSENVVQPIM